MRYVAASDYYYAHVDDEASSWEQLDVGEQGAWTRRWLETGEDEITEPEAPDDDVDMVNHPPHYNSGPKCPGCDRTIQCIDVVRWLPFNPGNAIKYLWRRYFGGGKAGEDSIQPVEKARWYLDDEVARLKLEEP